MSNAQKLTVQKFKRLITKPPATPVLLTITPEVAYEALTYNEKTLHVWKATNGQQVMNINFFEET